MAVALYDLSVVNFVQTLGAVEGFLGRGLDHCRDNAINPEDVVAARVYENMLPFRYQVISTISHSLGAIDGVRAGVFSPPTSMQELSYADLQKAVTDARTALEAVSAEEVNGFQGKDVMFALGERKLPFTAENFLMSFSLPNFYFHASMAYGILRSKGAPLGKRDFMGRMRMKM